MINNRKKIDVKYYPSSKYRYWLYSPENGMTFFQSVVDRDAYAELEIKEYLDDGWMYEVEGVCAGEVEFIADCPGRVYRPKDSELDENQCDREGANWPDDVLWRGHYKMVPIQTSEEAEK